MSKFFNADFTILHAGLAVHASGLVSQAGITSVRIHPGSPLLESGLVDQPVSVRFAAMEIGATVTQLLTGQGSSFEIKFPSLQEPERRYLEEQLAAHGEEPAWMRKFPRIAAKEQDGVGSPYPRHCTVRSGKQEIFVDVLNFTLGGLSVEIPEGRLPELRSGSSLDVDVVDSAGDILHGLKMQVRYFSAQGNGTRALGLELVSMGDESGRRYRNLVQAFCIALQDQDRKASG